MIFLLFSVVAAQFGWDYSLHGSDWTGLCADGKSQSPINIQQASTALLGNTYAMQVYYYGTTMSRTVEFDNNNIYILGNFGYITVTDSAGKDRQFNSYRIVFHAPSEHYIEGYPTHMEMQIFHKVDDSDYTYDFPSYAVVSVMLRPGPTSYFFSSIDVNNLPVYNSQVVLSANSSVNLISIVQADDNYYFYTGSMNEPSYTYTDGCEENVLWYVFQTEQYISFVQIGYFMQRLIVPDADGYLDIFGGSGNTRAVQPLNSRQVYFSYGQGLVFYALLIFTY